MHPDGNFLICLGDTEASGAPKGLKLGVVENERSTGGSREGIDGRWCLDRAFSDTEFVSSKFAK